MATADRSTIAIIVAIIFFSIFSGIVIAVSERARLYCSSPNAASAGVVRQFV